MRIMHATLKCHLFEFIIHFIAFSPRTWRCQAAQGREARSGPMILAMTWCPAQADSSAWEQQPPVGFLTT